MKSVKKALLLLLCAVLVVGASVFGTLAYLTDTEAVTNTFSVGSVGLSLDEAEVTPDGVPVPDAHRVQNNTYHLLPGLTYTKDPIIHVDADSSDSYIFVKVDNQIAAYEAASGDGYTKIADQITANGWEVLEEGGNVYWKAYTEGQKDENGQPLLDLPVFAQFQVAGNANLLEGWEDIQADDPATEEDESTVIRVTGYAVQKTGFDTALDAWNATFDQDDGEIPGESEAPDPSEEPNPGEDPDPGEEPDPSDPPAPSEEPDPDPSTPGEGGGEESGLIMTDEAFSEAYKAGGSIKLGDNVGFYQSFDPASATSDVVLDLNGCTLTVTNSDNSAGPFYAYRKMTIMDSKGNGVIRCDAISGYEIIITGGTIEGALTGSNYTITGGTFHSALNMSHATITGGTFTFDNGWLYDYAKGKLDNSVPSTHKVIQNSDGSYTVTTK